MHVLITGDWKVLDVGQFLSVESKSCGHMFQGGVCHKISSGSGFGCAAKRLRELLMAVLLALVL